MDYKKIYDLLICRAKDRKLECYTEQHHIIPKCMGGNNDRENLVRLTAREHFIAHRLLYKIYLTPGLAHAWFAMCRVGKGQKRNFTSVQYQQAKLAHVKELSKNIGIKNHFYGRKHSDVTKRKISELAKKRVKSQHTISLWVEKVAKRPKSEEHKKKIGRKGFTTIKNIETDVCLRVPIIELDKYNKDIWKNPSAIKQATSTCIYCGKVSVNGNIKRWHNENCKNRSSR